MSWPKAGRPYFRKVLFERFANRLRHIFQFVIESGQLKIDREAWEREGKEIEKENAEAENKAPALPPGMNPNSAEGLRFQARLLEQKSRQLEEKPREVERLARAGTIPPLHLLFRKVQEKAMRHPAGFGFGGPGYSSHNGWVEFDRAFRGNALLADLRTTNDGEQLSLEENVPPHRTVDFIAGADGSFRIQLCDSEGDTILLRQQASGTFDAVAMAHGEIRLVTAIRSLCCSNDTSR